MAIKYKCLILDHDDTAVQSTPGIHFPSFVELCDNIIGFTDAEIEQQQAGLIQSLVLNSV